MNFKSLFIFFGLFLPCILHAEELKIPYEKIHQALESYASTIGCQFAMKDDNVVRYSLKNRKIFIALYSIDLKCTGGTAMSRPAFAAIAENSQGRFFILSKYSAPAATSSEFPRFIDRIYIDGGKLWYAAKDFDFSKDALCCPSVPVKGRVEFKNGIWVDIRVLRDANK
jgi:hypothetical protein